MVHTKLPTDAELVILQVLWKDGPRTVRQVHDQLSRKQQTGYTTTLKLMQIMFDKGLVRRDESQRSHVYRSAISQKRAQRRLVGNLLDRAFDGSAASLVLQALSTKRASQEEIAEIRSLLEQLDDKEEGR